MSYSIAFSTLNVQCSWAGECKHVNVRGTSLLHLFHITHIEAKSLYMKSLLWFGCICNNRMLHRVLTHSFFSLLQHNVFRFQISVDDPLVMEVSQSRRWGGEQRMRSRGKKRDLKNNTETDKCEVIYTWCHQNKCQSHLDTSVFSCSFWIQLTFTGMDTEGCRSVLPLTCYSVTHACLVCYTYSHSDH